MSQAPFSQCKTENQVSKFFKENSNIFWIQFTLDEYQTYQYQPILIFNADVSDVTIVNFWWQINTHLFNIIILTDFTNPDKINKIRKFRSSGNTDCLVKTNVTGSDHLKQIIIWINPFHLTFLIKTNTFLTDWGELQLQ